MTRSNLFFFNLSKKSFFLCHCCILSVPLSLFQVHYLASDGLPTITINQPSNIILLFLNLRPYHDNNCSCCLFPANKCARFFCILSSWILRMYLKSLLFYDTWNWYNKQIMLRSGFVVILSSDFFLMSVCVSLARKMQKKWFVLLFLLLATLAISVSPLLFLLCSVDCLLTVEKKIHFVNAYGYFVSLTSPLAHSH